MTENYLKALLQKTRPLWNAWLTIPDAWTAELLAHSGFEALTIDMQHGLIGYERALAMLQAIATTRAVSLVRVPWNDPAIVMRMLDAGAQGIICPMINTADDAVRFVGACRYPPLGYRSAGPIRAELYSQEDYVGSANQRLIAMAMIETAEAMDNLEEILDTPGLDGVYIGPADLSISLGLPKRGDLDDPQLVDALEKIKNAVQKRGLIAGLPAYQPDKALKMKQMGFDFITPFKDSSELQTRAKNVLAQVREAP